MSEFIVISIVKYIMCLNSRAVFSRNSQVDGPLQSQGFSGPADVFVRELVSTAARPAGAGATGLNDRHLSFNLFF